MPHILSYATIKASRIARAIPGGTSWRTNYLQPSTGSRDEPQVFMSESTAGRVVDPHFHHVDQFQVFVIGSGRLGAHALARNTVHFTRAHTGYGPIVAGPEGIGWISLYAHWDGGAQYIADAKERLLAVANRRPWQVSEVPAFDDADAVAVRPLARISNDEGLSATAIALQPFASTTVRHDAASPMFIVVVQGSIVADGGTHAMFTVVHLSVADREFTLTGGPDGAHAVALQFPAERAAA